MEDSTGTMVAASTGMEVITKAHPAGPNLTPPWAAAATTVANPNAASDHPHHPQCRCHPGPGHALSPCLPHPARPNYGCRTSCRPMCNAKPSCGGGAQMNGNTMMCNSQNRPNYNQGPPGYNQGYNQGYGG